jgi:hypothetical protein
LYKILDPFITALNSLPKVALGPMIIIVAGANVRSVILMAVLINVIVSTVVITNGFYGTDIWGEYAKLLDGKIPQGMTIYGEIFGYMTGETKMIQKGYDYGCKTGTNKLMIYRINTENEFGENYEWNVQEVYEWTTHFLNTYPELKDYIHPIDILYHGTLSGLYPEIDTSNHWHENVLQALKNDKEHFNMEMDEPLCKNKVPREGVVIRIDNDPLKQAFKLKTDYFYGRESKMVDNGEVDIEMENGYGEN